MDPVGSRRQLLRRRRRRRDTSLADKNAALDKDGPDFDEPNLMDWTVQIRLSGTGSFTVYHEKKTNMFGNVGFDFIVKLRSSRK